jgi:hypothetical protein
MGEVLTQDKYIRISEALNFLKNKIKESTGKEINFLVSEATVTLKHFRPVTKEEEGGD